MSMGQRPLRRRRSCTKRRKRLVIGGGVGGFSTRFSRRGAEVGMGGRGKADRETWELLLKLLVLLELFRNAGIMEDAKQRGSFFPSAFVSNNFWDCRSVGYS